VTITTECEAQSAEKTMEKEPDLSCVPNQFSARGAIRLAMSLKYLKISCDHCENSEGLLWHTRAIEMPYAPLAENFGNNRI
jgi:hypothetical protein